jgi:hypothetical protein
MLTLTAFGLLLLVGWLVARYRLVPRRSISAREQLAGETVALLWLGIVALLVVATNPFALLFALPALHIWLWLPQVRSARLPIRLAVYLAGLAGPAIVLLSLALRFGLGLDAPWYLLLLVSVGYVKGVAVLIALAGAAGAGQLAAAAAGRYAPYPDARERGPYGPIRALVRVVLLAILSHRRRAPARRRATAAGS